MRISDWSSDVCSSDLIKRLRWKDLLMQAMEMGQVALTDPDVRLMKGPHGMVAGYNVQVAVDGRHGLIAHHAVTQDASDQNQLASVALEAKAALGVEALDVVADAGYGDAEQVKACGERSEEHTSELQSLMRISYAVF